MHGSRLQERELERLERNRYARRLGVVVEQCDGGLAVVRLPARPETLNRGGMMHGGAIASGLLSAAMLAAASSERDNAAQRALPLDLSVSFLRAVGDREISVTGRVVRRGRSIVHATMEAAAGTDLIATGSSVYRIESANEDAGDGYRAALARWPAAPGQAATRMSGSPYGSASGIEVLSEIDSEARLRMPAAPNADEDGCADPGALAGLVDNCGAFATYCHPGVSIDDSGATISMSVVFCPPVSGSLRAVGRVIGRAGSSFCSEIEVAGEDDGVVAASASVVYRIGSRSAGAAAAAGRDEGEDGAP